MNVGVIIFMIGVIMFQISTIATNYEQSQQIKELQEKLKEKK